MADIPSDVLQVILDAINQQRGLVLTKDIVEIAGPTPVSNQGKNTHIRVTLPDTPSIVVDAYYTRLSLSTLFQFVSKNIEDVGQNNVLDFLPTLSARRSVTLNATDFISAGIVREGELTTLTLQAAPDSLTFVGSLQIYLGQGVPEVPPNALLDEEGDPLLTEEGDFILLED